MVSEEKDIKYEKNRKIDTKKNQLEILDKLNKNNDHELIIESLKYGFDLHEYYIEREISNDIFESVIKLVNDILRIYRLIYLYVENNPNKIDDELYFSFAGFDNNYEYEYISYTNFLFKQDMYEESHYKNKKCPHSGFIKVPYYIDMIHRYDLLGKPKQLNEQNILELIKG